MSQPAYLQWSAIPGLDTSIMRITDSATFGVGQRYYRHYYPKQQPWNCDETKIMLSHNSSLVYFLHGSTFAYQSTSNQLPEYPKWSVSDPDKMYGIYLKKLVYYRPSTNTRTDMHDFTSDFSTVYLGVGEGNISNDDAFIPVIGNYASVNPTIVLWNGNTNTEVTRATLTGEGPLDWAGMSQSGNYFITNDSTTTKVYNNSLVYQRTLTAAGGHADLGYDSNGDECYVSGQFIGGRGVVIESTRLSDNTVTEHLPGNGQTGVYMASNFHISCRNTARPGWAYLSTYDFDSATDAYMFREVFAVKLDNSGTVERFSQGFFSDEPADLDYNRTAMGVPNRDGSLVMFASDWGDASGTAIIYDYIAKAT